MPWYEKEPLYKENTNCPICGRNLSEVTAHQLVWVGDLMKIYTCSAKHNKEFIRQIWKLSKQNDNADNLNTFKIGSQECMTKNLNITDDGLGKDHWKNPKNGEVYYSWKAAVRIAKKVSGYHIPNNEEWNQLAENCGGVCVNPNEENPGLKGYYNIQKLKKKLGIKLVGLYYPSDKDFFRVGYRAYFWSSVETYNDNNAYYTIIDKNFMDSACDSKRTGLSVRLVKDSV